MDLDISMRTVDCFFTVTFYGALFREVKYVAVVTYCSDVVIGLMRRMIHPYRFRPNVLLSVLWLLTVANCL